MNTMEEIRRALQSMQEKLLKLSSNELQENDRRSLLGDARDLVKCLERPEEVVFRQSFETHTYSFCIRLAVDLGIFHILVERGSRPIGSADLATQCGAEELLIGRFILVTPYNKDQNVAM